jgi:hypothetical protein
MSGEVGRRIVLPSSYDNEIQKAEVRATRLLLDDMTTPPFNLSLTSSAIIISHEKIGQAVLSLVSNISQVPNLGSRSVSLYLELATQSHFHR